VAYDNEFRRFLLTPVSFAKLETTLKTLFSLNAELRIKFQDDENDWVLITSDQELVYATELSGSPLRLQVTLIQSSVETDALFGQGRGRGGKGCRGGRGGRKAPMERLDASSSRLTERINQLETKLNSNLPPEREELIRWRLAKLQEKLAAVIAKKESLGTNGEAQNEQAPIVALSDCVPLSSEEEKTSCRGGRRGGRCGRGGWRRAMMDNEDGTDQSVRPRKPRMDPEIMANFRQSKADLQAARESGDAEKIQICLEAFKTAKATKVEARAALRAQQASNDEQKA
jgi:hypothetical protein